MNLDALLNHARMRPSKYGYTCYLFCEEGKYVGHGTTMKAAYEAFIENGNNQLMEDKGLVYFENRVWNLNACASYKRNRLRDLKMSPPANREYNLGASDHLKPTSNLPWWKRLFRV